MQKNSAAYTKVPRINLLAEPLKRLNGSSEREEKRNAPGGNFIHKEYFTLYRF